MLRAALLFGLLALSASPARADFAAIEFQNATVDFNNQSWSLGFKFLAHDNLIVTALGFYDDKGNGLTQSHEVGVFNQSGMLVGAAAVTPSDALTGHFRYAPIPGLLLQANQVYTIAAVTGQENYTWAPTGFHTDPRITYLSDEYTPSSTLTFPTNSVGYTNLNGAGFFGPDFLIAAGASTNAAHAPEPTSLTLLALGAVGVGACAWRRRRAARPA
jgi:hypothetical protein